MVLQRGQFDWHNIQFERSTGWALAIGANAALLLIMTLPMRGVQMSPPLPAPPPKVEIIPLDVKPPAPPVPPPPTAPERPTSVLNEVLTTPAPPIERAVIEAQPAPVEFVPTDDASATQSVTPVAHGAVSPAGDSDALIDYQFAPPPPYPRAEQQRGVEGVVMLRIEVDELGRVLQVEIAQSSGNRRLDRAAQQQVARHWRFKPAVRDGRPVAGWVRVPIEFSLRR